MENLTSNTLYTRNYPFIDQKIQAKLSKIKVALVGVGLASQVGNALVRVGVQNFKLWDKDTVSQSNLNRQAFDQVDIGKNKADVTSSNMNKIADGLQIESFSRHFKEGDLISGLDDVDITVNSADFETDIVYAINDTMQKQEKWCLQPLNLGFGGACIVFGKHTPSLAEMTGGVQKNPVDFIQNLLASTKGFNPSPELLEQGDAMLKEGAKAGWFPQNIVATLITTSLITWSIIKIVEEKGDEIAAPKILHFEPNF